MVVGAIIGEKLEFDKLRLIGALKAGTIKAREISVRGYLEVRRTLIANKVMVYGVVKAKCIKAKHVYLVLTAPSTIVDVTSSVFRVRSISGGRLSIGDLKSEEAILTYSNIHQLCIKKLVLKRHTFIQEITCYGKDLSILSPTNTFQDDPRKYFRNIKITYTL